MSHSRKVHTRKAPSQATRDAIARKSDRELSAHLSTLRLYRSMAKKMPGEKGKRSRSNLESARVATVQEILKRRAARRG